MRTRLEHDDTVMMNENQKKVKYHHKTLIYFVLQVGNWAARPNISVERP